jgi:hypothetical protein
MPLTLRRTLVGLSAIVAVVGILIGLNPEARVLAWLAAACGLLSILIINALLPDLPLLPREPGEIESLDEGRHRELVRGTSLYLRDMKYRYSVRLDRSDVQCRECFSTEVNEIRLGFVPVVITDNETDRQGRGYVAFVFDGRRWRGPGLPCPASRDEAVAHAARCVSPIDAAAAPGEADARTAARPDHRS